MEQWLSEVVITFLVSVMGAGIAGFFAHLKLKQQAKSSQETAAAEIKKRDQQHKQELEKQSVELQSESQKFIREQYHQLNNVIGELRHDLDNARKDLKRKDMENDSLLLTIQDTKERATAAERGEAIREGQVAQLTAQLKDARDDLLSATEKVGRFNSVVDRLGTLEKSLNRLQLDLDRTRQREAQLIEENNALTSTLEKERHDYKEERDAYERRLKALTKEVREILKRVSELETSSEDVAKEQQSIKSDLLSVQEEINVEDSNEGEDVRVSPAADPIPGG